MVDYIDIDGKPYHKNTIQDLISPMVDGEYVSGVVVIDGVPYSRSLILNSVQPVSEVKVYVGDIVRLLKEGKPAYYLVANSSYEDVDDIVSHRVIVSLINIEYGTRWSDGVRAEGRLTIPLHEFFHQNSELSRETLRTARVYPYGTARLEFNEN